MFGGRLGRVFVGILLPLMDEVSARVACLRPSPLQVLTGTHRHLQALRNSPRRTPSTADVLLSQAATGGPHGDSSTSVFISKPPILTARAAVPDLRTARGQARFRIQIKRLANGILWLIVANLSLQPSPPLPVFTLPDSIPSDFTWRRPLFTTHFLRARAGSFATATRGAGSTVICFKDDSRRALFKGGPRSRGGRRGYVFLGWASLPSDGLRADIQRVCWHDVGTATRPISLAQTRTAESGSTWSWLLVLAAFSKTKLVSWLTIFVV